MKVHDYDYIPPLGPCLPALHLNSPVFVGLCCPAAVEGLYINTCMQYNTIQYNTIQYNTIQHNTTQYSTVQYNTIQYNIFILHSFILSILIDFQQMTCLSVCY